MQGTICVVHEIVQFLHSKEAVLKKKKCCHSVGFEIVLLFYFCSSALANNEIFSIFF